MGGTKRCQETAHRIELIHPRPTQYELPGLHQFSAFDQRVPQLGTIENLSVRDRERDVVLVNACRFRLICHILYGYAPLVPSSETSLQVRICCYRFRNPKNIPTAPAPVEGR